MPSYPSAYATRLIGLKPGKSCVVPRNPRGLIATATKYVQARFSVRQAEGHFVVQRVE